MHHPTEIPKSKVRSLLPFIVCSLSSLFYVYEFFIRVAPSAITHELMHDFQIDATALGWMAALFYYGYTPMQIPAGLLFDRFGPRVMMSIAMATCALGVFLSALTHSFFWSSVGRFFMGLASAFAFIGPLVLASRWFPLKYFALITGLIQFMGCIGAIMGEAPVALLVHYIGWRVTFICSSLVGFCFALLFWFVIRDYPGVVDPKVHSVPVRGEQKLTEWQRLCTVCKNPQTWVVALCAFSCWAPITAFAVLWGVPFLMVVYHTNSATASAATSLIWLGIAVASPIVGWWSDYIRSRRIPLFVCYTIGLFSALGVIYLPHLPWISMDILLFFFGVAAASQIITFGLVRDNNACSIVGTAISLNNMAVIFGGVILQPFIGFLLHVCWSGQTHLAVPVYSIACYEKAFFLLPLCSLLGLIGTAFLKETYCQNSTDMS